MKKSILMLSAVTLLTSAMVTSCNSPAKKVENAEENVAEANQELDKANEEYLSDVENYRHETNELLRWMHMSGGGTTASLSGRPSPMRT